MHHPSEDIVAEENDYLGGREVVLGVTGSVAAYKAVDLARWLMRRGGRVSVVMTEDAARLVTPTLFEWATGKRVYVEFGGGVEHISLAREASAVAVAPATLTTMAKIAYGIGDTSVSLLSISARGYGKPVILAPAMHGNMWSSPQYRVASEVLRRHGYKIVEPEVKKGLARFPSIHTLGRVVAALARRGCEDLRGVRALVTTGATREWIDRVRFISNPSSGVMGVEIALELWARGAEVDLVAGHVAVEIPHVVNVLRVSTTEEMAEAVKTLTSRTRYDVVVGAGAPVDFRPSRRVEGKIKSGVTLEVKLEPTPKVLSSLASRPRVLVAFAAEYVEDLSELEAKAVEKMEKYSADIVVANRVGVEGVGFSSPLLEAVMLYRDGGVERVGLIHKEVAAAHLIDKVAEKLGVGPCAGQGNPGGPSSA